jgi:hypothetical protein
MPTLPSLAAMPALTFPMSQVSPSPQNTEMQPGSTTCTILGFNCRLYTLTNRFESLEVWVVPDTEVFPIRLLERDPVQRRYGPAQLDEKWVELLQKRSLFPLEATLRVGTGVERLSFKVTAVQRKRFRPEDDLLFSVPPDFQQIESPAPQ